MRLYFHEHSRVKEIIRLVLIIPNDLTYQLRCVAEEAELAWLSGELVESIFCQEQLVAGPWCQCPCLPEELHVLSRAGREPKENPRLSS